MIGTLAGIRVVEQGTFITGPCAGMMLADLGADVIKVESPEGDPYRSYQGGQYSPHFQAYNRNKRSLALDLKAAQRPRAVRTLMREADVFIQNFRPGTAERLGAGVERLQRDQPAPGLLLDQRLRLQRPVRRPAELRLGGAGAERLSERGGRLPAARSSWARRSPTRSPACMPPTAFSARWSQRGRTGRGGLVEVSMLEAMAHFAVEPFAAFFALGADPDLGGPAATGAGLHPAHRRPAPDRDSSVLAREILDTGWSRRSRHRSWRPIRASTRA